MTVNDVLKVIKDRGAVHYEDLNQLNELGFGISGRLRELGLSLEGDAVPMDDFKKAIVAVDPDLIAHLE